MMHFVPIFMGGAEIAQHSWMKSPVGKSNGFQCIFDQLQWQHCFCELQTSGMLSQHKLINRKVCRKFCESSKVPWEIDLSRVPFQISGGLFSKSYKD
jgi:hypothetical protein